MNTIDRNTRVTIASAAALCAVLISSTWWISARITNWERDLKDLRQTLEERLVGRSPSGWHKADMKRWIKETKALNPEWKPSPAWNSYDYGQGPK